MFHPPAALYGTAVHVDITALHSLSLAHEHEKVQPFFMMDAISIRAYLLLYLKLGKLCFVPCNYHK